MSSERPLVAWKSYEKVAVGSYVESKIHPVRVADCVVVVTDAVESEPDTVVGPVGSEALTSLSDGSTNGGVIEGRGDDPTPAAAVKGNSLNGRSCCRRSDSCRANVRVKDSI